MHRNLLTALILIAALLGTIAGCEYQDDGTTSANGDSSTGGEASTPAEPQKKPEVVGGAELSTHLAEVEAGEDGAGDRMKFDLYEFTAPAGWTKHGVRGNTEIVRVFIKGNVDDPDAKITVYRRRAASPDLDKNAAAYAEDWGGEPQGTTVSLGSNEAKLISREHPGDGLRIVDAVLCRWMVEDFIIQGEAKPGEDIRQVVLDMAASWQWRGPGG